MLGARRHYAVPQILHRAGMLSHFVTDLTSARGLPSLLTHLPQRLLPASLRRIAQRRPKSIPSSHITAFNGFGLEYARRLKAARTPGDRTAAFLWSGRKFTSLILEKGLLDRRRGGGTNAVYTFNSAGLELLHAARQRGLLAVMDQTIAPKAYESYLLHLAHDRFPEWDVALAEDPLRGEYAEREKAEWDAADWIVCGSEFVRQGIVWSGGAEGKCLVVPYGTSHAHPGIEPRRRPEGRKLRVLFLGQVNLRKGIPVVYDAARSLAGKAEFRVVGPVLVPDGAREKLSQVAEVLGSVPRSDVHRHYEWADVFVFPSLCEGSAGVTYEALACGLPLITTENSGSIVRDGEDGFIVPVMESEPVVAALERLLSEPGLLETMSRGALERAAHGTSASYQGRLVCELAGLANR